MSIRGYSACLAVLRKGRISKNQQESGSPLGPSRTPLPGGRGSFPPPRHNPRDIPPCVSMPASALQAIRRSKHLQNKKEEISRRFSRHRIDSRYPPPRHAYAHAVPRTVLGSASGMAPSLNPVVARDVSVVVVGERGVAIAETEKRLFRVFFKSSYRSGFKGGVYRNVPRKRRRRRKNRSRRRRRYKN